MIQGNQENSNQIFNPHIFVKDSSFEESRNFTLLQKISKENKNLTTIAKAIKESKVFEGQISSSSKVDIFKMLANLNSEERQYYFTLFFPNIKQKDIYSMFYYTDKLNHDKDTESEVLYQEEEEEINKMNKLENTDCGLMKDEYQNFPGEETISNEETKEGTDKDKEVNEKIDEQKLKDIFLQSIKFNIKDNNKKTFISFDIKSLLLSNNLEKILKYFTKNNYFKNWINPIYCNNDWYLPLPDWVYSITKFDVFFQTLLIYFELIIILLYEYYILTGSILPDNNTYMEHMNKISEFEKVSNSEKEKTNIEKNNSNLLEKEKEKKEQVKKVEKVEKGEKKMDLKKTLKYINVINNILKPYKEKKIKEIKQLCKILINNYYDINFIDYGSSITGLELPKSDIDTLIYYISKDKSKSINKIVFGFQLYQLLQIEKERKNMVNLSIEKILDAYVPLIKLEYDITNEIDKKYLEMLKKLGLTKVKIDITFTNEEDYCQIQEKVKKFIIKDLKKNPKLKPLVVIIKFYLEKEKLNNSHTGGLNAISVFFLAKHIIVTYEKENLTLEQLFSKFLDKYSKYDFTYGLDIYGNTIPYPQNEIKKIFISNSFSNNKNFNFAYNCSNYEEIFGYFKYLKTKICP